MFCEFFKCWPKLSIRICSLAVTAFISACGGGGGGGGNTPGDTQFVLTVSKTGTGAGSVVSQPQGIDCGSTCSAAFNANTAVILSATPGVNQSFDGWGGACSGSGVTCAVTMNQAQSVTAGFMASAGQSSYVLTTTVTGTGAVVSVPQGINCPGSSCSASFAANASVTLTASASSGQVFSSWGGACTGSSPTCVLPMTQARSVSAVFSPLPVSTWQAPLLLEDRADFNVAYRTSGALGFDALTAVSPNGNYAVLWEQSDGQPDNQTLKVWLRRYIADTGWQAAEAVPGVTSTSRLATGLISGQLFMDDAGRVTWLNSGLQARRFTPGSGWESLAVPAQVSGFVLFLEEAVMDTQGNIGVLMRVGNQGLYNMAAAPGGGWQTPVRIDQRAAGLSYGGGDIALSANGTAMAIWTQENPSGGFKDVMAARYTPENGWGAREVIEASNLDVQDGGLSRSRMRVVIDDVGNAIAMWHQGASLFYNRYQAGSGWQGAVAVDAGRVSAPSNPGLQLVMNGQGRAVAVWTSAEPGALPDVRSMSFSPSSGWTAPSTLASASDPLAYPTEPILQMNNAARAYLVYNGFTSFSPVTAGVLYRTLDPSSTWQAPTPIVNAVTGTRPYFAMNATGQGIAIWSQDDAPGVLTRNSLWASVLR